MQQIYLQKVFSCTEINSLFSLLKYIWPKAFNIFGHVAIDVSKMLASFLYKSLAWIMHGVFSSQIGR